MLIYNITIKISWEIHDEWLEWMRHEHIPEVMATRHFFKSQLVRLLEVEEDDGPTYAVQFYAAEKEDYQQFLANYAAPLRERTFERWGDQFISFKSVMEVIN